MTEPAAPATSDPPPPAGRADRLLAWIPAALVTLVALAYGQVRAFGFVNIDDQAYVYENALVQQGLTWSGARQAFTTFQVSNWHPLTWLSHMLDVELFGLDAGWHHLASVGLHAVDAVLLYALLRRLTSRPWRSALVAALFAIHPLHVESVAWISERKDVLSTLFLLLCLHAWVGYARRPGPATYLVSLGLFGLGLLCKPMLVTLPVLLLLLDRWPMARPVSAARLVEKAPFALLAAAAATVTWLAQSSGGAVSTLDAVPLGGRLANAAVSTALYLWKSVWPTGLAAFYPHPLLSGAGLPAWQVALSVAVLTALVAVAWRERGPRPWLAFGLGWYLVSLLPVIGLIQVGTQAMADRYTYVPLIGPLVAVIWEVAERLERWPSHAAFAWLAALPVLALTALAGQQVATWRDSATLHRHALQVTERNWNAWYGLGEALSDGGQPGEALEAYRASLEVRPGEASTWSGLGVALGRLGRAEEALAPLRQAVRLDPSLGEAWYNLGVALGALGDHAGARAAFERAVTARPRDARAWFNLGLASLLSGDTERARACLTPLRQLDPRQAAQLETQLTAATP